MIGLAALFILCLWILISYKMSKFIYGKFKLQNSKCHIKVMMFFLIFISPLADDIVGGIQFRLLCSQNSGAYVNVENARNKELFEYSSKERVQGYILPTEKYTFFFQG